MIKNTLVALDGSSCAEDIRRYAVSLSLALGAQMEAVHVVDTRLFAPPPLFTATNPAASLAFSAPTARNVQQILRSRGELILSNAAARSEEEGLSITTSLLFGHPAQLLAEIQAHTELLLIGHCGEHAPSDAPSSAFLIGSTTDRVVHRACRPCLVVPPAPPPPTRLLVAVDGSSHAFSAAHVAFELANALAAPLVILAVAEHPDDLQEAQSLAAEIHRLARAHDCAAATLVAEGPPPNAILDAAQRTSSSLLVVGSHGHGWIGGRQLGVTADHLLAHSPIPLLLVR